MKRIMTVLVALATVPQVAAAQRPTPLEIEDVVQLLQLGGSQEAKTDLIRRSCITFPVDASATTRLRAAGASDAMLAVLRDACFAGAELVIESAPAGAEVLIDNQPVGATPFTTRFSSGRSVSVAVRSGARTLRTDARLEAGVRTRAAFAFPEDTVPVPAARSVVEVANDLNLAQRWRPATPQPSEPEYPGEYGGFLSLLVNLGGAAGGAMYCADAENYCYIDPIIEDDGTDSMEPLRYMVGAAGGLIVGLTANAIIGKIVTSVRTSGYDRAVARRAEWQQRNEAARAEWIASHPDLVQQRRSAQAAREQALAHNAEVNARNRALQSVQVTTERLAPAGN